jgi:hypothetical protein
MTKIVKLDKRDIFDLVRIVLSEAETADETNNQNPAPPAADNQTQNTIDSKSEVLKQLQQQVSQMASNEDLGVIVSLFIILLTDDSSVNQMKSLGKMYSDHLKSGGDEIDFTKQMGKLLKPLAKAFVKSLVDLLDKEADTDVIFEAEEKSNDHNLLYYTKELEKLENNIKNDPELAKDPKIQHSRQILKDYIKKLKSESGDTKTGLPTTKNKIRQAGVQRINKMVSNPDVIRVFSLFMEYLTDKDTISDLKQIGSQYGEKLNTLIENNSSDWSMDLLKNLRTKFKPFLEKMAESIDKTQIKSTGQITPEEFKQDQARLSDIVTRYKL